MLKAIRQDEYLSYVSKVQTALREILPKLGFPPHEVEAVIEEHARLDGNWLVSIETDDGWSAFCTLTKNPGGWTLHSLIPSNWPERYTILRSALAQIRTAFQQEAAPGDVLHFGLAEDTPNHQFYFVALFPELGFELRPRISMAVDLKHLTSIPLPDLLPGVRELGFDNRRLPELAGCFAAGFANLPGDRPREIWESEMADYSKQPDTVHSWVSLEHEARIIGSCFGRVHSETATIYELAVLPEYYGRGLGKFLTLRCAQRLQDYSAASCTRCSLWTYRTLDRALALYYHLGFRTLQLWTEARYTSP